MCLGSSPRVWGQVSDTLTVTGAARIIPTRVGTSYIRHCINICNGDHPHACGDKVYEDSLSYYETGSSPRVWGQAIRNGDVKRNLGIIPTRVGTRESTKAHSRKLKDHPHACGDKYSKQSPHVYHSGSSPRVWGQEAHPRKLDLHKRIIPTRVGTRQNYHTFFTKARDHPHACGDKSVIMIYQTLQTGSSPRVWGQASALHL